jgi:Zn2+/Cd2+-exporting ATPase
MTQVPALKTQRLQVGGMDCTSCAMKIEGAVEKLAGVAEISVVVATGRMIVIYDSEQVSEADIKQRVTALGYTIIEEKFLAKHNGSDCCSHDHSSHDHGSHDDGDEEGNDHDRNHSGGEFSLKREGVLVGVVIVLFVLGSMFEETLNNTPYSIGEYAVFMPAYLLSDWTVLTTAGRNILRGQVFDENFLMTIATVGAIAIHIFWGHWWRS